MEVFEEIYQGAFRPDFEKRGKAYEAVSEKLREKIQVFSCREEEQPQAAPRPSP